MRRLVVRAALVALATLALAPDARAQLAGSFVHLGVSGGATFPTGGAITSSASDGSGSTISGLRSNDGWNANAHLAFQLPLFPLGLRADAGWSQLNGRSSTLITPGAGPVTSRADRRILSGTLNALLMPTGLFVARPYLIGGVGAYNVRYRVTSSGAGSAVSFDRSKTSFGLNGGAGVRFGLVGLNAFIEARYHYVLDDEQTGGCQSSGRCFLHRNTSFVPVSLGVMF